MILKSEYRRLIEEKEIQESLRAAFEATLLERVSRYLEVRPHKISPDQHFALVSGECATSRLSSDACVRGNPIWQALLYYGFQG